MPYNITNGKTANNSGYFIKVEKIEEGETRPVITTLIEINGDGNIKMSVDNQEVGSTSELFLNNENIDKLNALLNS